MEPIASLRHKAKISEPWLIAGTFDAQGDNPEATMMQEGSDHDHQRQHYR
jgi:hypothetical protein